MKQYNVIIPLNVKKDIDEIISFYFADRKDYARKILSNFSQRIRSLEACPEKGRIVPEFEKNNIFDFKELIESYWRIIYRIEHDEVVLYAIIDGRRNIEEILMKKLKTRFSFILPD
jgi:toxin ParE1/3/4